MSTTSATVSNTSTATDLLRHWRTMTLIRRAEETIAAMVESGAVRCPCHLYIGQEAIAPGRWVVRETRRGSRQ
jgi:TPP-dependent pyruvate/acetoin dehydrogenase alpha subunit